MTCAVADGPLLGVATAVLLLAFAGCGGDTPQQDGGNQSTLPCQDGVVHDLGVPGPFDRYASFEVAEGPVWFAVKDSQVTGVIDPRANEGFSSLVPSRNRRLLATMAPFPARVNGWRSSWSRLDLSPGSYWLLGPGNAGRISIQSCEDATGQAVTQAGGLVAGVGAGHTGRP